MKELITQIIIDSINENKIPALHEIDCTGAPEGFFRVILSDKSVVTVSIKIEVS